MNEAEAQKATADEILRSEVLNPGDKYYVVSYHWYVYWREWLDGKGSKPGPIENKELLSDPIRLKANLRERENYTLIPNELWSKLKNWYQYDVEIERKVTRHGYSESDISVEVNPLYLRIEYTTETKTSEYNILFDRTKKVSQGLEIIARMANKDVDDLDFFIKPYGRSDTTNINTMDAFLYSVNLSPHDVIIVRDATPESKASRDESIADENNPSKRHDSSSDDDYDSRMKDESPRSKHSTLPLSSSSSSKYITSSKYDDYKDSNKNDYRDKSYSGSRSSSGYGYSSSYDYNRNTSDLSPSSIPGIVGLSNLGNTCFMNSGLQCLSNTPELRQFFIDNSYVRDLNPRNVLGTGGELAKEFAALMKAMWQGGKGSVAPRAFKFALGRFATQFSGYQQHDSQELLSYLMDGLHEDLNRVINKPYVEQIEQTEHSDEVTAQLSWENHLKRNQSIIVDLFHGQFKSRVQCLKCPKVSVTFDPFMYLSLHLPNSLYVNVKITLFRADGSRIYLKSKVPKSGSLKDVKEIISKETNIAPKNLVFADVYYCRIYKIFEDREEIANHTRGDTVLDCFELEDYEDLSKTTTVNIHHYGNETYYYGSKSPIDTPYVVRVKKDEINTEKFGALINKIYPHYIEAATKVTSEGPYFKLHKTGSYSSWENEWVEMVPGTNYNTSTVVCIWNKEVSAAVGKAKIEGEGHDKSDSSSSRSTVDLRECLELFTKPETLTDENLWYCPTCKEHQRATKQMELWKLPNILVVQLKRFSYTAYYRDKLDTLVDFPTKGLDMSPYCLSHKPGDEPLIYDLFAVSNHMGGLGGGHYTAYCKNSYDQKWRSYDDSYVGGAHEESVVSSSAYVLFYRRRTEGSASEAPPAHPPVALSSRRDERSSDSDDTDEEDRTRGKYNHALKSFSGASGSGSRPIH